MWYDNLKVFPQDKGLLRERLVEKNTYVDLSSIHSAILWKFLPDHTGLTAEDKDRTLQYILPLIQQGELLMLLWVLEKNDNKSFEQKKYCDVSEVFVVDELNLMKGIDKLRIAWNTECSDLMESETWFALPENRKFLEDYRDRRIEKHYNHLKIK